MMRALIVGPVIAFGLVWPLAAAADQTDPRLDALFETLKTADTATEIRAAEARIWSIWIEHDDPALSQLMRDGISLMAEGRLEGALYIYDDLIEADPDFAEAWNKRATVHYMMGNLAESVADVAETLRLEPRHFGALSGLGQIELARGDPRGALEAFRAALQVHPHLPGAERVVERLEDSLEREI